jgi:hypothetical protein
MVWKDIVALVSVGLAFVVIRRLAARIADERAQRERQRNVEEAINATKLSDVAKHLRLSYALDAKPSVVSPPPDPAQPEPKPQRNIGKTSNTS